MITSSVSSSLGVPFATTIGGGGGVIGGGGGGASSSSSHAVCRSDEFLSCAKTAVKLAKRRNQQQQQHQEQHQHQSNEILWWMVNVDELRLYDSLLDTVSNNNAHLEESIELLRGMHTDLQVLEGLVRRRGHTNDPTEEIQVCTDRLQRDTNELLEALGLIVPKSARGQAQKHYQLVSDWIKSAANEQGSRLQKVLKTRAAVLAEQAQRRKLFTTGPAASSTNGVLSSTLSASSSTAAATTSAALSRSNPLFTIPAPPTVKPPNLPLPRGTNATRLANGGNGSTSGTVHHATSSSSGYNRPDPSRTTTAAKVAAATTTTAINTGYGYGGLNVTATTAPARTGYATSAVGGRIPSAAAMPPAYGGTRTTTNSGSYYGGGYGGASPYGTSANGGSLSSASGMRQRRPGAASTANNSAASQDAASHYQHQEQERLLVRQQERQAQERLREARQAESSLVELGAMFGKMSQLISSQGEVVSKIEDDVEAAHVDVQLGHSEIQTLYGIKKGNRGLILKTFGLLIFFIVFMRLYKSK